MDGGGIPLFNQLPERCISREPESGKLVVLTRGQKGFRYLAGDKPPEAYNRALGLSYEQVEAMEYGALVGFDNKLADPEFVRNVRQELGQPVGLILEVKPPPPAEPRPQPSLRAKTSTPVPDIGKFLPEFEQALAKGKTPAVAWG